MINWGILGTGNIAKTFAKAIKDTSVSNLLAVGSRSKESAELFSSKFSCIGYGSYQQLLDNKEINAIYIATPHPSHFELSYQALMKDKSVLCEKPISMNSSEALVLFELAKNRKLLLMEAFMYRVHPQTDKIREVVEENFKNKKIAIKASFGFRAEVEKNHRLLNPELGGGSILDIGCYPLSMARMIVGSANGKSFMDPESYEVQADLSEDGVDLSAEAKLMFSDGSKAYLSSSIKENLNNSVEVTDGKNTLIIKDPWHCGEYQKGSNHLILKDLKKQVTEIEIESSGKIYTNEINHFYECLIENKIESSKISHSDSYGNAIGLDIWRKSAGVKYDFDKPENAKSSFYKPFFDKNYIIPKSRINSLENKASKLVFGCDNQIDINHAFSMFDYFYSIGGNVFDTAFIYNNGKSDEYLGRWINSRGLENDVIVLGKGAHTPDCYPEVIRDQLLKSLSRLKIDCLDIYCLHRDNKDIPVGEFIDALDELKNEGLIKVLGASNWSLVRFKEAINYAEENNKNPFEVLSNNFSLADMVEPVWPGCESSSKKDFKEFLRKKSISLFPWSSQARGFFLKSTAKESYHPADPNFEEQKRVWHSKENLMKRERCFEMAKNKGFLPIEIALAYVLHQDFPVFPLIGPRNFSEAQSSANALKVQLTKEEIKWLDLT